MPEPVNIVIDGRPVQTASGELLIKAAQDHGTYIPRFCWHPRMKPVGMCRMCLVQIETPRGPALITACTNTVAEGMVVHTQDEIVKKAQEGILEFLLINHPLDCPVCDRGGECPLQDQVMAYGPGESRFVEEKRHFEKPIPISDLVFLDRERCILCARCTRFSEEVSGDPLLVFKERGNYTQIQTFPDEPFRSYFSGNTVQICPVGALTSSAYRFKARPWDLTAVESTCTHCTAGDRISVQSSQNQIIRFLGVDSDATNHGWLSDKCRFGFEYLGSADRLTAPLLRQTDGSLVEVSWSEALDVVSKRLGEIVAEHGGGAVAGLGGARGTNEEAYAFGKFLRSVIGTPHLDAQMDDGLDPQFLATVADRATLADLDSAGAILVWAADLKEEHPTLYLRVRRAAQELGVQLVVIHPRRTGLDDRASIKLTYRPGAGGDLLTRIQAGELTDLTAALSKGSVVALIGRTGYTEDPRLAEAVAAFIRSLPGSKLLPLARRSNVYGALDMGLAPTLLPGRVSAVGGGR
ncbi:MAG TPA: NADH-quinone oxidoreductase subunit NuoG, partial [Acidimicrobiia bacterium]|nr:NADH-quinone oxidoreductase subunit NuoG [Acidimicrobiia bacterium]